MTSFGISIPIALLPGIGASIRTLFAARFIAISSLSAVTFFTLVPLATANSNLVIEGPVTVLTT